MNHLPECSNSMIPDFHNERWICICAALRACEQRVLDLNPVALGVLIAQRARERALDAAEEAVRAALGADERNLHAELTALAAIDDLRVNQPMASGGIYAGLPIPLGDGCVIPKSGNTALREKP